MIDSTKSIIGQVDDIYSFSLLPEMKVEDYIKNIKEVLKRAPSNTILITDLHCGTTTNVALMLSQDFHIKVVTGLNMYLLIQIEEMRKKKDICLEDVLQQLIEQNRSQCKLVKLEDL